MKKNNMGILVILVVVLTVLTSITTCFWLRRSIIKVSGNSAETVDTTTPAWSEWESLPVHCEYDEYQWVDENLTQDLNRLRADIVHNGTHFNVVYDGSTRTVSVWSFNVRYANYSVTEGVEVEYVHPDSEAEKLAENAILFRDEETGELWLFDILESANDYLVYPGGHWHE